MTSPTVTPGSVDAISTEVAHVQHTDILYITARDYLPYVDPAQLSPEADRERFVREPKYFFDDKDDYSLASAVSSDLTEVTGGRDTAVKDFMNALQEGKKVILVRNPRLPKGFDTAKSRPNNAEEYLETMIESRITGQPLPYPPVHGLDGAYVDTHLTAIEKLVKVDDIDHPLYLSAPSIEIVARAAGRIAISTSAAGSDDVSRRPENTPASRSPKTLHS